MAKQQRFPIKLEFWTNEAQYEALCLLAEASLVDRSAHLRTALAAYLAQHGAIAALRPHQNGHDRSTDSL